MPTVVVYPARGQVAQLYARWNGRWRTVVVDNFRKVDQLGLGYANTGQDWVQLASPTTTFLWEVMGAVAHPSMSLPASTELFAHVGTRSANMRAKARVKWNGVTGVNTGICYRLNNAGTVSGFT